MTFKTANGQLSWYLKDNLFLYIVRLQMDSSIIIQGEKLAYL